MKTPDATRSELRFVTTESVILGGLLGAALMVLSVHTWMHGHHLVHDAIGETLWTAIYLTMVVAFCDFLLPTFFVNRPRLSIFCMVFMCGHVSLFFDSFAVVLLLNGLTIHKFTLVATKYDHRFNAFAFKTICAYCALTVGGGFYIGELWGLPYFISSGLDNPLAGLPLLLVLTPYCCILSLVAAYKFPVRIESVPFTRKQIIGTVEICAMLAVIILTHRPFFCLALLLLYSALTCRTVKLVKETLHELQHGAANAIGLILIAMIILHLPGTKEWCGENIKGPFVWVLASISSPFAGAMVQGAPDNLSLFYLNLSLIMLGAPMFVSSSLVAIVVFRDTLQYIDLPPFMKPVAALLGGKKNGGTVQEAVAYTLLVIPMNVGLAALLFVANYCDIFATTYRFISGG